MKLLRVVAIVAASCATQSQIHAQIGAVGIGTTNPQAQLHTTASVRHDTLAGNGERSVYVDAVGRLFAKPAIYFSNNTAYAIPDSGCATGQGAASSITVSGLTTVPSASMRVRINVVHPTNYQLSVFLQAPNGQIMRLVGSNYASNYFNTIFSDAAAAPLSYFSTTATGHFRATGGTYPQCSMLPTVMSFAGFGGGGNMTPNGVWTLRVFDAYTGGIGTLLNWSLSFGSSDSLIIPPVSPNVVPRGGVAGLVAGSIYDAGTQVGINNAAPHAQLQLGNAIANRKLILQEAADNDHRFFGFGINHYQLRHQVAGPSDAHVFYAATSDSTSAELLRITGTGQVGIGNSAPHAPLHFANAFANRKIVLSEASDNDNQFFGLGANSAVLRYQIPSTTDAHVFYAGTWWSSSDELVRITGSGRVGIRNATPHADLQLSNIAASRKLILNEWADNDHQFVGFGANTNTLRYQIAGPNSVHEFLAASSATTSTSLMRVYGNGNVEIGNGAFGNYAKLEIYGGANAAPWSYRYMNNGGEDNVTGNSSPNPYSLYTSERIWCGAEINVTSDVRTKTRVAPSVGDLALINRLRVVDYNYIDRAAKGNTRVKGFLAQEVEAVMPEAVMLNTGVVPNIYAKAETARYDATSSTLTLVMKSACSVKVGDTLKLITDDGDKLVPVVAVQDSTHFAVGDWKTATEWAFVYGTQVHDLRNLDYNKIFSAGISAIQELSREVNNLEKRVATVEANASGTKRELAELRAEVQRLIRASPTASR